MNINALLSPDDGASHGGSSNNAAAGARAVSTESPSPPVVQRGTRPAGGKRTASGLSQQLSRSPERHISPRSNLAASHTPVVLGAQQQQQYYATPPNFRPPPPTSNPLHSPEQHNQYGRHQRPGVAPRPLSNPQVETLGGMLHIEQVRLA